MGFFDTLSKTALTIWFIFSVKKDIIVLHVCAKFQVRENFCSRDMGQKGVKMGFFGTLSKRNEYIWFILLGKKDIYVLRVHAKFHDESISGSRNMGSKGVKNGVFWGYLKK